MNFFKKIWFNITTPIMALVVNIKQSKEYGDWDNVHDR